MSALGKINPVLAAKNTHVGHGMVRNADGTKMSSRAGTALTAEGLLNAVKDEVYAILKKSSSTYTKGEEDVIAEAATIAAVKYSFLRVSLPSDIAFDIKSSVSFDGDSGPYLLYTYARCQSVLRKAGIPLTHEESAYQMNPEERAIARLISHFSDVVAEASDHLAPSIICSYVNDLAQAFNLFYAKHTIVEKEESKKDRDTMEFRLKLTSAVARVLSNALRLLGISTVERM
jgi:arginyl-tRNA synthetase